MHLAAIDDSGLFILPFDEPSRDVEDFDTFVIALDRDNHRRVEWVRSGCNLVDFRLEW